MAYTLEQAVTDTRRLLNDDTENVWTSLDIKSFINEAILIIRATIPEYFTDLVEVTLDSDLIVIDDDYKKLATLFAAARCFEQDEQFYRGVQKMNEFESRKAEMEVKILSSQAYADKIADNDAYIEYVEDVYFNITTDDEL